jgi:adenosylmethionine-8-amino-7-oxononanoate aminotransferase
MISQVTSERVASFQGHPKVQAVRSLGTIGVVELGGRSSYFSEIAPRIRSCGLKYGILIRPLGNVIYFVPPYCISNAELNSAYDSLFQILEELDTGLQTEDSTENFQITDV